MFARQYSGFGGSIGVLSCRYGTDIFASIPVSGEDFNPVCTR